MNSQLFVGLHNLVEVKLTRNICINDDFLDKNQVEILRQIVDSKCAPSTDNKSVVSISNAACIREREMMKLELTAKTAAINQHLEEIATLKAKLQIAEASGSKIALIKLMLDKLDVQHNATCDARTEELQKTVENKSKEISD